MIEVYIGLHSGGWALDGLTQDWSAHGDPAQGLERWGREIAERHAGRWRPARADLWLSGGLARPFLCGPLSGLTSWPEAETYAAAVAPEATGLAGPCRAQLEDWPGNAAAVATAIDTTLAEAIDAVARSCRIAWRSVRPRWAAALDEILAQQPSTALVAVAEDDALTLLCRPASSASSVGLQLAQTYAPAPDPSQSMALWQRLVLSHDLPADGARLVHMELPQGKVGVAMPNADRQGAWPRLVRPAEGAAS